MLQLFGFRYFEPNSLIGVVGSCEPENDLRKAQDFAAFLDLDGDGKVDAGEFSEALSIMVGLEQQHLAHCLKSGSAFHEIWSIQQVGAK